MSTEEDLYKRNLIAEISHNERILREKEALETVEESGEFKITFNDYSKASKSSEELAKFLGRTD